MKRNLKRIAGFTLDQTILVVAVIAILATIIITTVAWSVISKATSTKLVGHLNQVGESIGNRYQDAGAAWPTNASDLEAYLAGYIKSGNNLITPFGTSSATSVLSINSTNAPISTTGSCTTNDCYITVNITNIQAQEVIAANGSIDGKSETTAATQGRLRWTPTTATGTSMVTLTYYAVKTQ